MSEAYDLYPEQCHIIDSILAVCFDARDRLDDWEEEAYQECFCNPALSKLDDTSHFELSRYFLNSKAELEQYGK